MKTLILCSILAFPVLSQALTVSVCREQIVLAEKNVMAAESLVNAGEADMTTIWWAQVNLLNTRFECRDVSFSDYCQQVPALYANLIAGEKELVRIGQKTNLEVLETEKKASEAKALCQ